METAAIDVREVTKRFGERTAVDKIDLVVPAGRAFGFLGHNGAGKTTLIRMILGLTQPDAGAINLLGHDLPAGRSQALARVGAIVEQPRFYEHLSAYENLVAAAAVRGDSARQRIGEVLARTRLEDRKRDKVRTYSTGMRQRLGLARALLSDPLLLILDEPTNGLDPSGMLEFRTLVRELVDQEGRTVFLSSHLLDEIQKICDEVAIVDRGRLVEHGSVATLTNARDARAVEIGCDEPGLAATVLRRAFELEQIEVVPGGIQVRLPTTTSSAAINRALVLAGVGVWRLEPLDRSLEERFLALTAIPEVAA